jgi:hypothetical protein
LRTAQVIATSSTTTTTNNSATNKSWYYCYYWKINDKKEWIWISFLFVSSSVSIQFSNS